jgi:hypothetical protein
MPSDYSILQNPDAECAVESIAKAKSLGELNFRSKLPGKEGAVFAFQSESVKGPDGQISVVVKPDGSSLAFNDTDQTALTVATGSFAIRGEEFAILESPQPATTATSAILWSSGAERKTPSETMRQVRKNMLSCKPLTS